MPFPSCIVLSAGGAHAAAYVGAIKSLEDRSLTRHLRRFHGTSAGAVVAAMAACGLTGAEMMRVVHGMCGCGGRMTPRDVSRLPHTWGALDVEERLRPTLDAFLRPGETFASLAQRTGAHLSVHAFNVETRELVDFGLDGTPDADVRAAVCASCCVPLLFAPVRIGGAMHADGAVAQRTPMHMVVTPSETLVLDVRTHATHPPRDVFEYVATLTSAASRHVGGFAGRFITIEVPPGAPGLTEAPIDPARLDCVVAAGRRTLDTALELWGYATTDA